jgi:alkanesulfonate monooxygenase SsuD/methylene tetrahydromethanopterin reductase-like flavin-dependent oxidoreductase (luciferase family)
VRRAGHLGDAWISDPIQERQDVKALAATYRQAATEAGRLPYLVLMREAWVSTSKKAAQDEYGPLVLRTLRYYYRHNLGAFGPHIRSLEDITIDAVSDKLIWGSPEECVEQIQRWREEIRMDYLVLMLRQATGPAHERVLQAIRTFGERVIPHVA